MKINNCILQSLKRYGKVELLGFGVFSLKDAEAVINTENGNILPPAKQVVFLSKNIIASDFDRQVAMYKAIPITQAQFEIETQIEYWKKKIDAQESFYIEHLGTFKIESNTVNFIGERVETIETPDFYGLEAINLAEITPKTPQRKTTKNKKSKAWIWILLAILAGIAILAYLKINYPEVLWGQQSLLTP